MLNKTISKISVFVISATLTGCAFVSSNQNRTRAVSSFGLPEKVGTIRSGEITESSGIAASRCQTDVLWTHNDSGNDPYIFALSTKGKSLGTWKIPGVENIDWEDIAAYKDRTGKCFLYIGEIGDNDAKRNEHIIYRVVEPLVTADKASSGKQVPLVTAKPEMIRFHYPDRSQDAETLMIQPKTADIYVITKSIRGPANVYRIKPDFSPNGSQKAELISEIVVPAIPNGFLTGGDISPDGRHVVICDYTQAYEFVLPANAANFDEIWKQKPETIDLGARKAGEAVCYNVDGTSIFATSEGLNSPIIMVNRIN